jgi:hypothetical protein
MGLHGLLRHSGSVLYCSCFHLSAFSFIYRSGLDMCCRSTVLQVANIIHKIINHLLCLMILHLSGVSSCKKRNWFEDMPKMKGWYVVLYFKLHFVHVTFQTWLQSHDCPQPKSKVLQPCLLYISLKWHKLEEQMQVWMGYMTPGCCHIITVVYIIILHSTSQSEWKNFTVLMWMLYNIRVKF